MSRLDVSEIAPALVSRVMPTSSGRDRVLPVLHALAPLLPDGGLRRGTVVGIDSVEGPGTKHRGHGAGGSTTLGFSMLASASVAGVWCAAVGTAGPGVLSMAEMGIDLDRLALVPLHGQHVSPPGLGSAWPEVTAILLDGMDVVLLSPPWPARSNVARRLVARARERRAVLVVMGPPRWWPEGPDVRMTVTEGEWHGVGTGHGHLQGRRVEVTAAGRRNAGRTVKTTLWLPSTSGEVTGETTGADAHPKQALKQALKQAAK